MNEKRCSKCGVTKKITDFARDNTRDRWQTQCKQCRKERYDATKPPPKPRKRKGKGRKKGRLLAAMPKDENGRPLPYWKWTAEDSRRYQAAQED